MIEENVDIVGGENCVGVILFSNWSAASFKADYKYMVDCSLTASLALFSKKPT